MSIKNNDKKSKIVIKIASEENFFDLNLCAENFIELIDNFKEKFLNDQFFVLSAYCNDVLVGILVAEDKSRKIDSLERIVPTMNLSLLFINPHYRNRGFGKRLMNSFVMILLQKGFASISIQLPKNYIEGIHFFLKNDFLNYQFRQIDKTEHKIVLEMHLWNDYGIINCELIELDSHTFY
jgi:GNAT superfamily N-acetyltransferase